MTVGISNIQTFILHFLEVSKTRRQYLIEWYAQCPYEALDIQGAIN